jgi:hypothetical protein
VPYLALAIKSVSLARMTRTLMETYLGRDAGQRRRRRLVQRFAGIHPYHRHGARTGNPIAERLFRCDRFSNPRTWR